MQDITFHAQGYSHGQEIVYLAEGFWLSRRASNNYLGTYLGGERPCTEEIGG